ncbi:hypothetical protein ZIOFF_014135 [Zingiber officinale]|uniref:Uncharacterized protein n=1 Tax=Zingiber officinale TaxID=94328 RepID=A0A8J5HPM5_ZINOF|nr:hypothetical protein ZIOFF_014135 [Zingiber officinale]
MAKAAAFGRERTRSIGKASGRELLAGTEGRLMTLASSLLNKAQKQTSDNKEKGSLTYDFHIKVTASFSGICDFCCSALYTAVLLSSSIGHGTVESEGLPANQTARQEDSSSRRPEGNSLDLNNLPDDHGKQPIEESSMTTAASAHDTARLKKKKSGGKDDSAKVYECRFCSLKFCKSQALGERETETLNRARQLVFNNEGLSNAAVGLRDLNIGGLQIPPGGFPHGDPCIPYRSPVYPPRLSTTMPPPNPSPMQQYYQHPPSHPPEANYYVGHVQCPPHNPNYGSNFTCFGTPLSHSFPVEGRDGAPRNQTEAKSWGCSYGHVQHMDPSVDRFRDNNFHG